MSGGHFDYQQFRFEDIAREIERVIKEGGYPKPILKKFAKAARTCRRAGAMVQRVDYLLSGDDGEDTFLKRWKEELDRLKES